MNHSKSIAIASLLLLIGVGFIGYNKHLIQTKQTKKSISIIAKVSTEDTGASAGATSSEMTEAVPQQKIAKTDSSVFTKSDSEWKKILSADQYAVLRQSATEKPYTSDLVHEKRKGSYVTADCHELVFRSEQKFDSGTGWPSFYAPAKEGAVIEKKDNQLGTERTEIVSAKCGSHLGHVFNDAPQTPTGLRYCINGLALLFIPD